MFVTVWNRLECGFEIPGRDAGFKEANSKSTLTY